MAGSTPRTAGGTGAVVAIVAACALLAGCGGDDPATAATSPSPTVSGATPRASGAAAPAVTTVTATPTPTVSPTVSATPSPTVTVTVTPTARQSTTFSAQDRAFLIAAHQANLAEIAASRNALDRARTAAVRSAARRFIADHQTLDTVVQELARAAALTLPTQPTRAQRASLAAVAARSGTAYDRAWIGQQMASHDDTLEVINAELARGQAGGVRAAAQTAKPVVLSHMDILDQALRSLTGTRPTQVAAGTGGQAAVGDVRLPVVLMALGTASLGAGGVLLLRRRRAATS